MVGDAYTQKLFREDSIKKNYRISFPNGEHPDITNDQIVARSVKFTESICSKNQFKFGLAESSVFSFSAHGIGDISDCVINVEIEAFDGGIPHSIPLGVFKVSSCEMQNNNKIWKVVAYTSEPAMFEFADPVINMIINGGSVLGTGESYEPRITPLLISNFESGIMNEEKMQSYGITGYTSQTLQDTGTIPYNSAQYQWTPLDGSSKGFSIYCFAKFIEVNALQNDVYEWLSEPADFSQIEIAEEWMKENHLDFENAKFVRINYTPEGFSFIEQGITWGDLVETLKWGMADILPTVDQPAKARIEAAKETPYIYPYYTKSNSTRKSVKMEIRYGFSISYIAPSYDGFGETISSPVYMVKNPDSIALNKLNFSSDSPSIEFKRVKKTVEYWDRTQTLYAIDVDNLFVKDINEGLLEINALFLTKGRKGETKLVDILNVDELLPSNGLYPSDELLPIGNAELIPPSVYMSGKYAEKETKKYGKVVSNYNSSDGSSENAEVYLHEDYEKNPDIYQIYDLSQNSLIRNLKMTAEQCISLLKFFGNKIKDFQYYQANLQMKGLPYLEAGDRIQISTRDGKLIDTFVFRRSMSGIQSLTDNIDSK